VPTIVPADKLVQANAFTQLSASASAALGFLVGSGLLAVLGAPLAFVTNATSFLFSAWMLSRIRHHGPVGSISPGASSLGAGFDIIRSTPVLRQTVGVVIAVNLVFSSILVLLPVFGEGHFQGGSAVTGLLMASYTGGMFLAAALLGTRPVRATLSVVLVGSVGILTLAFLAMGTWVRLGVFLPSLVLVGFVVNAVNICLTTVFQRVVSPEDRGKFFAVFTAGAMSSQPIAYALAGLASDRMPPERILQGCGFGLGLIVLRLLRAPELRQHRVQG
jgi:hypothetical protein